MATYTPLSTDFKDDILASQNSKRKYTQVNNSDGTVSFQDSTAYSQVGSSYGAKTIDSILDWWSAICINRINRKRTHSLVNVYCWWAGVLFDWLYQRKVQKDAIGKADAYRSACDYCIGIYMWLHRKSVARLACMGLQ